MNQGHTRTSDPSIPLYHRYYILINKWSHICDLNRTPVKIYLSSYDIQSLNSKYSKQKGEKLYLRTFGGEHKEAAVQAFYNTETKKEGGM